MFDRKTSIGYVESRFPQLSEELHEETWDGLLHLQVAVFSRWAQSVIDDGDRDGWHPKAQVFLDPWRDCTPDVQNALNVSFLEHLNFTDGMKMDGLYLAFLADLVALARRVLIVSGVVHAPHLCPAFYRLVCAWF